MKDTPQYWKILQTLLHTSDFESKKLRWGTNGIDLFGRPYGLGIYPETFLDGPFYILGSNFDGEDLLRTDIYSFDREVFSDCRERLRTVVDGLALSDDTVGYCAGAVKYDAQAREFTLDTVLGLAIPQNNDVLFVLDFLHAMTEEPAALIYNKNAAEQFTESARRLKEKKISLRDLLELYTQFHKSYSFEQYGIYRRKERKLNYWEIQPPPYCTSSSNIEITDRKGILYGLANYGIIQVDYPKILWLKEQEQKDVMLNYSSEHGQESRGLTALRRYIQHASRAGESIATLSEKSTVNDVLRAMPMHEVDSEFPFTTKWNKEFVLRLLSEG